MREGWTTQPGIPGRYNEPHSSAGAKNDGARVQQFAVIVRPNPEDGGFVATVPDRPGVVGRGRTEEAALEDARIALESTSESGDGQAANSVEDTEGTPRPFDARPDLAALATWRKRHRQTEAYGISPTRRVACSLTTSLASTSALLAKNSSHDGTAGITMRSPTTPMSLRRPPHLGTRPAH